MMIFLKYSLFFLIISKLFCIGIFLLRHDPCAKNYVFYLSLECMAYANRNKDLLEIWSSSFLLHFLIVLFKLNINSKAFLSRIIFCFSN